MSDMRIAGVGGVPPVVGPRETAGGGGAGFGEALRQALGRVNDLQQGADRAAQAFSVGETRDVAGTLIAVEKANLSFQLTLQIRNKLLEAYQEIVRMPM
jgi:flagellar hook-basal body complex protein FliE